MNSVGYSYKKSIRVIIQGILFEGKFKVSRENFLFQCREYIEMEIQLADRVYIVKINNSPKFNRNSVHNMVK